MALSFLKEALNEATSVLGFNMFSESLGFPHGSDYNDIYSGGMFSSPNEAYSKTFTYGFEVRGYKSYYGYTSLDGYKRFVLQINPQQLTQDEEFSIQFFPTPTGITIEHQGSIMKDIVISGTTGIHPRRGAGGVDVKGDIIFGSGDSGYKQFHDLRNYIRSYVEMKKKPQQKDAKLIFFNFKDQEFFVVEPTKFSLKRSENRPMLYDYTIALKVVGRVTDFEEDTNLFDKILGAVNWVADRVFNAVVVIRGILNGSIDLLTSVDREVRKKVLGPLLEVQRALDDYRNGRTKVLNLRRKFIKDLKQELRSLSDNLASKAGVDTSEYDEYLDKQSSTGQSGGEGRQEPTYEEQKVLNACKNAEQTLALIYSDDRMFKTTTNDTIDEIEQAYSNTNMISRSTSSTSVQILEGDTLQDIAARELGDGGKFDSLIVVNNLKYPYIASDDELTQIRIEQGLPPDAKVDGVLSYKDKILIPISLNTDESVGNVRSNIEYEITRKLSPEEKKLGVDIRINKNNDIAITNSNDYDLIAGSSNIIQRLGVRLGVDKGSYKLHASFGVDLGIGEPNLFNTTLVKTEIQAQLAQEPALEPGTQVVVKGEGNKYVVTIYAKFKRTGQSIPLQLASA